MKIGGKGQGMPIHVIVVVILGIIILAVVLLYIFGVLGQGGESSMKIFDIGQNVGDNASGTVQGFFG